MVSFYMFVGLLLSSERVQCAGREGVEREANGIIESKSTAFAKENKNKQLQGTLSLS